MKNKLAALAAAPVIGIIAWSAYNMESPRENLESERELTPQEYVAEQLRACAALESALRISLEEAEAARAMDMVSRLERGETHD